MREFTLNNQEDSFCLHIHQLSNLRYILIIKQIHCINNMKFNFLHQSIKSFWYISSRLGVSNLISYQRLTSGSESSYSAIFRLHPTEMMIFLSAQGKIPVTSASDTDSNLWRLWPFWKFHTWNKSESSRDCICLAQWINAQENSNSLLQMILPFLQ